MPLFGRGQEFIFHTEIGIEECVKKLESSIDKWRFWTSFGRSKEIIGQVNGYEFRLTKRTRYKNSFRPFFYGKFSQEGNGTRISGHFSINPFVKMFIIVWFSTVILFGVFPLLLTLSGIIAGRTEPEGDLIFALGVPVIMLLMGVVIFKLGTWLGRNDEKFIVNFIQSTFSAKPVMPPGDNLQTPGVREYLFRTNQ